VYPLSAKPLLQVKIHKTASYLNKENRKNQIELVILGRSKRLSRACCKNLQQQDTPQLKMVRVKPLSYWGNCIAHFMGNQWLTLVWNIYSSAALANYVCNIFEYQQWSAGR
jgi:hypothetical protein